MFPTSYCIAPPVGVPEHAIGRTQDALHGGAISMAKKTAKKTAKKASTKKAGAKKTKK
jgi:hypothetical protein